MKRRIGARMELARFLQARPIAGSPGALLSRRNRHGALTCTPGGTELPCHLPFCFRYPTILPAPCRTPLRRWPATCRAAAAARQPPAPRSCISSCSASGGSAWPGMWHPGSPKAGTAGFETFMCRDTSAGPARTTHRMLSLPRSAGEDVPVNELLKFSKLFNDELTLDNLERWVRRRQRWYSPACLALAGCEVLGLRNCHALPQHSSVCTPAGRPRLFPPVLAGCSWCRSAASWASSRLGPTPFCAADCGGTCRRSRRGWGAGGRELHWGVAICTGGWPYGATAQAAGWAAGCFSAASVSAASTPVHYW